MRFACLALLLVTGCFDPKPPAGVPCSNSEPCPTGQRCVGGTCDGDPEQPPGGDASVNPPGDGSIDGPGSVAKCAGAIPIGLNDTMVTGSLAGATDDFDLPVGCGGSAGGGIEVVYVYTIPAGGASITMNVSSPDFTGKFYMAQTCPPIDFTACGSITNFNGGTVGTSYNDGKVYLVIERGANQSGTSFTIRP